MPSVVFSSATSTTLTFSISGTIDWGQYTSIRWKFYDPGFTELSNFTSTGTTQTFGNSTPLSSSTTYYCYVWGVKVGGTEESWGSASGTTLSPPGPPVPTVTVTHVSGLTYNISWSSSGATKYDVIFDWSEPNLIQTTSTSKQVTVPSYGSSYTVAVMAYNASGVSSGSAGSATIVTPSKPKLATPSYVSHAAATNLITINVSSVANATGYEFECGGNTGNSSSPSYTFTNLTPNTNYTVRWRATISIFDQNYQNSDWGSRSVSTLPGSLSVPTINYVSPGFTSVYIDFNAVGGANIYDIFIYTDSDTLVTTAAVSGSSTIGGLATGTSYYFRIRARDTNGNYNSSSFSGNYSFTTKSYPSIPQFNTNLTTKGETSITLYWSYSSNATYELQYKLDSSGTWTTWSSSLSGSATVSGLTKGLLYNFRVRGYVSETGYYTDWSGIVSATPGLRPQNFSWTFAKNAGDNITVAASEWTNLGVRVREFQQYKNITQTTFTTVSSGDLISASIVNQMINAIASMNPPVSPPSQVVSGVTVISAGIFNILVSSLNSIV